MANNKFTYQQIHNVSINKERLREIASNPYLSKTAYKVLICLFTELNGWVYTERSNDPLNFKKVDLDSISDMLHVSKKDVKKAFKELKENDLIETGSSETVKKGYRFTF